MFRKCLLAIVLLCFQDGFHFADSKKSHVVLFLADDLGWNDVSFHGSKQIPTPNVDSLAADGIILNHHYVQPLCTPSRGCIMTGKYPIRLGLQSVVIGADEPWGLPLSERLLPEYLKSLGYSTHAVGKWHLGYFREEYLPTSRGFDSFFGYYNGLEDYYSHFSRNINLTGLDLHDNTSNCWNYDGVYGPDLFANKAKRIIEEHDPSKPLFLYFAQQSPHSGNFGTFPLQPHPKYLRHVTGIIQDEERRQFAAMVLSMDSSVGEVFEALEKAGLLDDTLFVFSTDNGGAVFDEDGTSGSNWPLRGAKNTLFEGGVRGAAFVWSPTLRRNRRIYNGLTHLSDFLPTILAAAGGEKVLQMLPEIDGREQWSSLNDPNYPSLRDEVLLNIDSILEVEGIRKGRYKLLRGQGHTHNGRFNGWFDRQGRSITNKTSLCSIFESTTEKILYKQNYLTQLAQSKVARVLWRKYSKDPRSALQNVVRVHCGGLPPPSNVCDPYQEACVFDVVNDPCEFQNIAHREPEVKAELEAVLDKFRQYVVPSGYRQPDPLANPIYHGGAWVPWR